MKLVFHQDTNMSQAMSETVGYVNRARAFMPPGTVPPFITRFDAGSVAVGLLIFAIIAYAIVMLIAWLLGRVAKLPVLGIANGIAGALLGACKALFGAFLVLYVVLFFPLPRDLQNDLHRSALVSLVTQPDPAVDDAIRGLMPWFVRPLLAPFFVRHHV